MLDFVRSDVPSELAALVAKMMAKERERRFQAPGEVAKALAPFFKRAARVAVASDIRTPPETAPTTGRSMDGSTHVATGSTWAPSPAVTPLAERNQNRPDEMWQSLIDLREPRKVHGWRAAAATDRKRPRWFSPALAGLVGSIAILCGALIIYRIATDKGQLVIETEDPNIEVVVKQGGKQIIIIDPQTGKEVELRSGRYELELPGQNPRLKLSSEHFTLKRGDRTIVTVRREPPAPTANAGPPAPSMSSPAPGEIPPGILLKNGGTAARGEAGSSRVRENKSSQPPSDLLGGPSIEEFSEIARFQSPHDLPGHQAFFLPDGRHVLYTTGQDVQNDRWLPGTDPALWLGDIESPKTPQKFAIPGPPGKCSLALLRDGRLALTTIRR